MGKSGVLWKQEVQGKFWRQSKLGIERPDGQKYGGLYKFVLLFHN